MSLSFTRRAKKKIFVYSKTNTEKLNNVLKINFDSLKKIFFLYIHIIIIYHLNLSTHKLWYNIDFIIKHKIICIKRLIYIRIK